VILLAADLLPVSLSNQGAGGLGRFRYPKTLEAHGGTVAAGLDRLPGEAECYTAR
jgi:hypothetical protein